METTVKIIKGRNKKYNNQVLILNNCEIVAGNIWFGSLEFNNKIYKGSIDPIRNNMTISSGSQSIIQFDEIQILS
jgi:hypothetical protein